MDYERAAAVVDEFQDLLAQHRAKDAYLAKIKPPVIVGGGSRRTHPDEQPTREALAEFHAEILQRQPLIEDIAVEVDAVDNPARFAPLPTDAFGWRWASAMEATQRLVGVLRNRSVRSAILGPSGPLLAANQLHPWVWNAAVDRWDSSHWTDAVDAAARAVEELTQHKTNLSSLSGPDLYSKAFSTEPPEPGRSRLRFSAIPEKSEDGKASRRWTSAHEGAGAFGRGCAQGIRNMHAHGTAELSEQQAIEFLAALSVLARWVDTADVVREA
ncbi:TIGR02391 family protein [Candidatus Poriferisodalis sp.]|uniref:TIGR02391 family protein n=1 Tax=Candidatus Poriferisodalis sp. TaxID=3101277 RepID=UPI003B5235C0